MKNEDGTRRLVLIDLESFESSNRQCMYMQPTSYCYSIMGLPVVSPAEVIVHRKKGPRLLYCSSYKMERKTRSQDSFLVSGCRVFPTHGVYP